MITWLVSHPRVSRNFVLAWDLWKSLCGLVAIGALLVWVLVWSTTGSKDDPVWEARKADFQLLTPKVRVGGTATYIATAIPRESCPGEVVHTFAPKDKDTYQTTVSMRRRIVEPGAPREKYHFTVQMPPSLPPGRWKVTGDIESKCATREQLDPFVQFEIEVEV